MITKELENIAGSFPALRRLISSFDINFTVKSPAEEKTDELASKAIWVIALLHFFISMHQPGASKSIVSYGISTIVGLCITFSACGIFSIYTVGDDSPYEVRVRRWTATLVSTWFMASLILLVFVFFIWIAKYWMIFLGLFSTDSSNHFINSLLASALGFGSLCFWRNKENKKMAKNVKKVAKISEKTKKWPIFLIIVTTTIILQTMYVISTQIYW